MFAHTLVIKKYMVICFIADYHVLFCIIRVLSRESV